MRRFLPFKLEYSEDMKNGEKSQTMWIGEEKKSVKPFSGKQLFFRRVLRHTALWLVDYDRSVGCGGFFQAPRSEDDVSICVDGSTIDVRIHLLASLRISDSSTVSLVFFGKKINNNNNRYFKKYQ